MSRPYYEQDGITIYHGDSRDIAPGLTAQVVVTDPPYSSGGFQESGKSGGSIGTRSTETIQYDNLSTRGYERLMREVLGHLGSADELFLFTDWRMWITASEALAEEWALLRALRETRAALLRIANWQPAALAGFPKLQGEAEAFYDLREFAAAALRAGEEPRT